MSASVAQLVEQRTENPRVVGSIPTGGTISADLAHLVERDLAKVEVAGSSPVIRSIGLMQKTFCFLPFIYAGKKQMKAAVFIELFTQSESRGVSSAGRASALQAEGHRFEPCTPHHNLI